MKGLLLKDWYMALKYCKMFVVVIMVFLLVSVFGENASFFLLYPIFLAGMVPVTLVSYDERCRWNIYCQTLPCKRSRYVSGKYVVAAISVSAVWLLTLLLQGVRTAVYGRVVFSELLLTWSGLLAVGLIVSAINLPVIFRFGSEKGRLLNILLVIVAFSLGGAISTIKPGVQFTFSLELGLIILLAAGVAVFVLSWILSVRLYQRREL